MGVGEPSSQAGAAGVASVGAGLSVGVDASAGLGEECADYSLLSGALIEECVSSVGCVRW